MSTLEDLHKISIQCQPGTSLVRGTILCQGSWIGTPLGRCWRQCEYDTMGIENRVLAKIMGKFPDKGVDVWVV